jgi:hypothetical protein
VVLLPCAFWNPCAKAESLPVAEEAQVSVKAVTGEVTSINRQAISVEYSKTSEGSYEMLLPITKDTRLERVQSLTELKAGDTVTVDYEQRYKAGDHGERIVLGTVAKRIALMRRAPPEGSLVSRGAQEE